MTTPIHTDSKTDLGALRDRLTGWLVNFAYPLWSQNGIDPQDGGFIETLAQNGAPMLHARRARVQPRQLYAFAQAPDLGWSGDVQRILLRGVDYFSTRYRRDDGLFRTLVAVDGHCLDDRAVLYDQAFALLGYAAAGATLGAVREFEPRALDLRQAIAARFRTGDGAFRSTEGGDGALESNPHMHLLEACLAWAEIGSDPGWSQWSYELADLALKRFIRPDTGALAEFFAADWQPAPGLAGRLIEPGHQFEWAWLLLRSQSRHPGPLRAAALRLIAIGEQFGVRNHVAVNALLDDFSVHDPNARFWPQTERLKAALLAAETTGAPAYLDMARSAAESILRYLDTPVAGLWLDVQLPTGELVDAPSPASTFYHLVCAIVALEKFLTAGQPVGTTSVG